ncbi:MAG: hypothetical protein OWT27_07230 [Firmicutes bacterium]|nr:hypothetical protein [Bacillota bacterium]
MGSAGRNAWLHVFNELQESVYAQQVLCSITVDMATRDVFARQTACMTLHRENYETTFHRTVAAGHLSRLQAGEDAAELVQAATSALRLAALHDARGHRALKALTAPTPDTETWLLAAANWHQRREYWLRRAIASIESCAANGDWDSAEGSPAADA